MREIKFRGKRVDKGEWLYGKLLDLVINEMEAIPAIRTFCQVPCPYDYMQPVLGWEDFIVDENTVGQYTGLKDKNDNEIYEGDILGGIIGGKVVWLENECRFGLDIGGETNECRFEDFIQCDLEVIGNIYENPELLKGWQLNDR